MHRLYILQRLQGGRRPCCSNRHGSSHFSLSLFVAYVFLNTCYAASTNPKGIILALSKDAGTRQFVTTIGQQTPLRAEKVVVDLAGLYLWVNCDSGYNSTTARNVPCHSSTCRLAKSKACGSCSGAGLRSSLSCGNNSCSSLTQSPVNNNFAFSSFAEDVVVFRSSNGRATGAPVTAPRFAFACGADTVIEGLAAGLVGAIGLGRSGLGLPNQLAGVFGLSNKFAICLPSSSSAPGFALFGDVPYVLQPGSVDASKFLVYTPLLVNPVSGDTNSFFSGRRSDAYFINVMGLKVNGEPVPVNTSLLTIDTRTGLRGTSISTIDPFTVLEASIHQALVDAFVSEASAMGIGRVPSVDPFGACFGSQNVRRTRLGPVVPVISLVLGKESSEWKLWGANTIVDVSGDVMCLAFIKNWGPIYRRASIHLGTLQLQDHLLQFDVGGNRFGFSSSLLAQETGCSNFNF